jgi:outer membrane protein OmpA-like peptidoglycan-associated protein
VGNDTLLAKPSLLAFGEREPELIFANELLDTSLVREAEKMLVVDTMEYKAPETITITPQMLREAKPHQRKTVLKHQFYFETGSAQLPDNIQEELDEVAALLINNSQLGIVLNGFADKTGSEATNKELSKQRAFSLLEKLRSMGVNPERSIVKGYGESLSKATKKGEMVNERRVDVYVYELIKTE